MKQIPKPLQPLVKYPQFILFKLVWDATKQKYNKIPISPHTYQPYAKGSDWQNKPGHTTTAEHAIKAAALMGDEYGVGFLFTKNDPLFFLDIDNCLLQNFTWSPLAMDVVGMLPGAAVEVSQSGRGLHIFGKGIVPEHSNKNIPLGLELYTQARFVALTGAIAIGLVSTDCSASYDCSAALPGIVDTYFPPKGTAKTQEWTEEPVPGWNGITDDNELIQKALASRSAAGIFNGKSTFASLWNNDQDALARSYPDPEGNRPYDSSSADAALAQHLCFWTGNDCERIKSLMWQSGLKRYKWEREDYLIRTILKAASMQRIFYKGSKKSAVPVDTNGVSNPYIKADELEQHFEGLTFVVPENRFHIHGMTQTTSIEGINGIYGGHIYEMDLRSNAKTTRKASEAILFNTVFKFPKALNTTFDPSLPHGLNGDTVNLFKPPEIPICDGDVTRFTNHISKLFPEPHDQEIIISFLAYIIQNIGKKIRWCPVIIGTPGNGKSTISVIIESILGYEYCHTVKSSDLGTKGKVFNGWMLSKLFATLEEISGDRVEVQETLLTWITNLRVNVEAKGVDEKTIINCINYIAYSNKDDAVRVTSDGRRFAVLYTAQDCKEHLAEHGLTESYFNDLYQWLNTPNAIASIAGYLKRYEIKISMNVPPISTTHHRAIEESKSNWQLDIEAAIAAGEPGARGGFVIPRMVAENVPKRGVDKFMRKLGYRKCKNRARVYNTFYRAIYTNNVLSVQLSGTDLARKITEMIYTGEEANFSTNKR